MQMKFKKNRPNLNIQEICFEMSELHNKKKSILN